MAQYITPKFLELVAESLDLCRKSFENNNNYSEYSEKKRGEINQFKKEFQHLRKKMNKLFQQIDSNRIDLKNFDVNMFSDKELEAILFCLRQNLYNLEYSRRFLSVEDDAMIDLSGDITYCESIIYYFEDILGQ